MFLFSSFSFFPPPQMTDIVWKAVWENKGHRHLIVTPTSASSLYRHIYINHCGSRVNLGLHVNWWKEMLFFVCLYWWKMFSFFGTYALDISSLTSSIEYISENYERLLCFYFFLFSVLRDTRKMCGWATLSYFMNAKTLVKRWAESI